MQAILSSSAMRETIKNKQANLTSSRKGGAKFRIKKGIIGSRMHEYL